MNYGNIYFRFKLRYSKKYLNFFLIQCFTLDKKNCLKMLYFAMSYSYLY